MSKPQDVVTHAPALLGGEKISRGSPEIVASLGGADRRRADGIDHRVNPFERRVQTPARNQVNAERAADANHHVPLALKERDGAGTDIAGRTSHSYSHGEPPVRA